MKLKLTIAASVSAMLLGGLAMAEDQYQAVRDAIGSLAPDAQITDMREAVIPGMVEVSLGGQVVFVTEDGRYLVQGTVFDIERRVDVTEERKASGRAEVIAGLDRAEMVSFPAPNEQHSLYVFTDIDCGYCRRMHQDIEGYMANGISIHYLGFPRAGVDSGSHEKLNSVWCASDRQDAMTRAKAGESLPSASCPTPVADQYQLGQELGVSGTPALVTSDGYLIPGYSPPDALLQRLQAISSND